MASPRRTPRRSPRDDMPGLESSSGSESGDSESDTHGLVKQANAMAGIRDGAERTASHYVSIYSVSGNRIFLIIINLRGL